MTIEWIIVTIIGLGLIAYFIQRKFIVEPDKPETEEPLTEHFYIVVPYEKAKGTNWCLPSCLAMLSDYYGDKVSQGMWAEYIMLDNGSGSNISKAIRMLKELGYNAVFKLVYIDDIPYYIEGGEPLITIMGWKLGNKACHARMVTGYDMRKEVFIHNDSSLGADYEISFDDYRKLSLVGSNNDYVHALVIKKED